MHQQPPHHGYGDPNAPSARGPLPPLASHHAGAPPGARSGALRDAENFALIALITGLGSVLSLCCCCVPLANYMAVVIVPGLGVCGILTGWLALRNAALSPQQRTQATAGIAAGATGLLIMAALIVLVVVLGVGSAVLDRGAGGF